MNNGQSSLETNRVRRNTAPEILERIDHQIEENVRYYSAQPDHVINRRIRELQEEWSIERWLELNASTIGFTTAILALINRKFGVLTCAALGFFLGHAIQGWDPPLPLLRRLGIRTRGEIDREMYALKVIRGDFQGFTLERQEADTAAINQAIEAVKR